MNQHETSEMIPPFFARSVAFAVHLIDSVVPDEHIQSMDGGIADIGDLVASFVIRSGTEPHPNTAINLHLAVYTVVLTFPAPTD